MATLKISSATISYTATDMVNAYNGVRYFQKPDIRQRK
jgi:hypothetical protein